MVFATSSRLSVGQYENVWIDSTSIHMNHSIPINTNTLPLFDKSRMPAHLARNCSCVCIVFLLNGHNAVQCDSCDMWINNACSFIAETQYETVKNTKFTWICPKCEFFNFSDSFFGEQLNVESENRFVPLTKEKKDRSSPYGTNKSSFTGLLPRLAAKAASL